MFDGEVIDVLYSTGTYEGGYGYRRSTARYKQVELSLSNPCLMYVERSVGMRKSTGNDRGHG